MKSIAELIEAGASVDLAPLPSFTRPPIADSADGLHIRWPDAPQLHLEDRMQAKRRRLRRSNPVDYAVHRTPGADRLCHRRQGAWRSDGRFAAGLDRKLP